MVLNFSTADEVPASLVLRKVRSWKVAPGVQPETFTYLRVRGTKYLVGLPAATARAVLAEKDSEKIRRTIASLSAAETAAARANLLSPGKMLLLVQSGDIMSQVTTVGTPPAPKTGSAPLTYRGRTFPGYNQPVDSNRAGKKKMVLVKRDDKVRLVHFGQKGYRHNYSEEAKKSYLARSAGIRSKGGKLTKDDPFSPNYWARRVLWPENKKVAAAPIGAITDAMHRASSAAAAAVPPTIEGSVSLRERLRGVHRAYTDVAQGHELRRARELDRRATVAARLANVNAGLGVRADPQALDQLRDGFHSARRGRATAESRHASTVVGPAMLAASAALPVWHHMLGAPRHGGAAGRQRHDAAMRTAPLSGALRGALVGAAVPIVPLGHGGTAALGAGGGFLGRYLHTRGQRPREQRAPATKVGAGLGSLAGAAGGVNAGADHGILSAGVGGLVGSLVGEYVLPMVEHALLAAGPEFAQVAKPAALLASGLAGEISGRLVGNILQPRLREIQERSHERA